MFKTCLIGFEKLNKVEIILYPLSQFLLGEKKKATAKFSNNKPNDEANSQTKINRNKQE